MKFVHFKEFVPLDPVRGLGYMPGFELMMTELQIRALSELPRVPRNAWDLSEVPPSRKTFRDLIPGDKVGFFYPSGIGDAAMHTSVVAALHRSLSERFKLMPQSANPFVDVTVFSHPSQSPVWYLNPMVDGRCARPAPTMEAFEQMDAFLIGESVLYGRTDREQPNAYELLAAHFGVTIEEKDRHPFLFVSEEESNALHTKLQVMLGADLRQQATLLFAPLATKMNRSWPPELWEELVRLVQTELQMNVVALGDGGQWGLLKRLDGICGVLAGSLTVREMIVLAHEVEAVVTVDSALLHLAAGFGVATVGLFGPFSGAQRAATYSTVRCLSGGGCPIAPCCHHDTGFPKGCPVPEGLKDPQDCAVLRSISPTQVLESLKGMISTIPVVHRDQTIVPAKSLITLHDR